MSPPPVEHKDVFGVTFEQGRNELKIDESLLENLPTQNKTPSLPKPKRDLIVSLITLKYTPVQLCVLREERPGHRRGRRPAEPCPLYPPGGQTRRTTGTCASVPKVLNLPFKPGIRRADRDNTIDVYIGDEYMDVLADGQWEQFFTEKPEVFTREERRAWLDGLTGVAPGQ